MKNEQVHFGTDPEYLIVDSKGKPIPAHKAGFPGKEKKWVLKTKYGSEDGARAFRDGYMVEINIAPSHCRQTMSFRMQRSLAIVQRKLHEKYGYKLVTVPAVKIDLAKDMARAPLDVKQFGCEPSYCAYDNVSKIPPIDAMTHEWRYSGAHLHFSPGKHSEVKLEQWKTGPRYVQTWKYRPEWLNDPKQYPEVIKLMDQYIGLPLTCLFHSDALYQRRRFYGQAGEYRAQKYKDGTPGLEYRTPGPELWNLPWVSSLVLDIGRYIVLHKNALLKKYDEKRGDAVRHAINTGKDRWKLLRELPGRPYGPAMWRALYQFDPITSTPTMLIEAEKEIITDGFGDWWKRKKGKKR